MTNKIRCKVDVRTAGMQFPIYHRCARNAVKDGYCTQHHPDTVEKRREEADKRYEEKRKNQPWYKLAKAMERIQELEEENRELKEKND